MHWTLAAQHGDIVVIAGDAAGEVSGGGELAVLAVGGLEVVSDVAAIVGGEVTVLDLGHVG